MPGDRLLEVPIVLEVKGKSFRYVRTRAYDPTLVYRGRGTYLRIGPTRLIDRELGLQKWLLDSGFPVAEVVDSGVLLGRGYFVEKSLGKATFTTAWGRDYRERGRVAARGFSRYMGLTRRFLLAQLSTAPGGHGNEFDAGVHIADTLEDLLGMKNNLLRALGQAKSRISVFPVVFCHGDFSPANFLDRGVVDFEWSFWGYAGYEAVTSLYWTYFFPKSPMENHRRLYEPTPAQSSAYLGMVDEIYRSRGLPKPSEFVDDFMLPKAIWAAAKMGKLPKLQKWRFGLLESLIEAYSDGRSCLEIVLGYPS